MSWTFWRRREARAAKALVDLGRVLPVGDADGDAQQMAERQRARRDLKRHEAERDQREAERRVAGAKFVEQQVRRTGFMFPGDFTGTRDDRAEMAQMVDDDRRGWH